MIGLTSFENETFTLLQAGVNTSESFVAQELRSEVKAMAMEMAPLTNELFPLIKYIDY
jgi:hypothetical protein